MRHTGLRAIRDGRTFEVAPVGRDRWCEVDERGRPTGPELRRSDFERLERVTLRGRLDGYDVEVRLEDEGLAAVRGLPLPREVVEAHGLTGNPRDGWTGIVAASDVTDVREERREMESGDGGAVSVFRTGKRATVGGRTFPVRSTGPGVYTEVAADGSLTGPTYRRDELERLVAISNWATLDGRVVGVEAIDDGVARVNALMPPAELVQRWGLEGNPYDGFVGHVPVDSLEGLHEVLEERRTR